MQEEWKYYSHVRNKTGRRKWYLSVLWLFWATRALAGCASIATKVFMMISMYPFSCHGDTRLNTKPAVGVIVEFIGVKAPSQHCSFVLFPRHFGVTPLLLLFLRYNFTSLLPLLLTSPRDSCRQPHQQSFYSAVSRTC